MDDQDQAKKSAFKKVDFAAHTVIFEEGAAGDAAYMIRSGRIDIRKGTQSSNPQTLAELGKGDVIGELALFDDRPRMASAVCLTDVVCIRISRDKFHELMSTMDPAMESIVLTMVKRVRDMADEFMRRKSDVEWINWKKNK
jgi:CRP-like cAMP-binding protein